MEIRTNDLILRTVDENNIEEMKYRNRGYATQCAMELINYAFDKMGYDSKTAFAT